MIQHPTSHSLGVKWHADVTNSTDDIKYNGPKKLITLQKYIAASSPTLYSLSGQGWKSVLTLQTWECTFSCSAVNLGTNSVVPKCLEIGTRITCPEWMRLFWMAQFLLTCWSHITARWLSSMSTGLLNSETFLYDGHNKEELFRYLVECTAMRDSKMIVSTSDDAVSSMNHKHLITISRWNQDCSFVCAMLCEMVMTGSWYAQQTYVVVELWVVMVQECNCAISQLTLIV